MVCFRKLYPQPNSPHRVGPYKRLEHNLHMTVIDYLVKTSDIKKFEQLNSNIAVNVYEYEDEVISPSEYQVFMRVNSFISCCYQTIENITFY